jgi:hypothetical protein
MNLLIAEKLIHCVRLWVHECRGVPQREEALSF